MLLRRIAEPARTSSPRMPFAERTLKLPEIGGVAMGEGRRKSIVEHLGVVVLTDASEMLDRRRIDDPEAAARCREVEPVELDGPTHPEVSG